MIGFRKEETTDSRTTTRSDRNSDWNGKTLFKKSIVNFFEPIIPRQAFKILFSNITVWRFKAINVFLFCGIKAVLRIHVYLKSCNTKTKVDIFLKVFRKLKI